MEARAEEEVHYPESDGKPIAETDFHRIETWCYVLEVIEDWFEDRPDVYVSGGNLLYFVASPDGSFQSRELWVTDGNANNTVMVKDLYTLPAPSGALGGSRPRRMAAVGSRLVFVADDGTGDKWYATNGTAAGTVKLGDATPGPCGPMGSDVRSGGDRAAS